MPLHAKGGGAALFGRLRRGPGPSGPIGNTTEAMPGFAQAGLFLFGE